MDPKYEDLYKRHGTGGTTRTKDDGWYSHFKQDMAVLRGGADSMYMLIGGTPDSSAEPTGPFWRLHGRRGQVVFHDLVSFRLAVDRLLGLRQRGGVDVLLVVRDDASLRAMIDTKKFTTGTEEEDNIFNQYIQPRDPSADRRTYYLTLPQLPYPKTSQWVPDKNDKRVLMVRRDGDTQGEVAYLNLVPFFNPLFASNPELGSRHFTAYLCDVANLLIPETTPGGQSLVHRIVGVRAGGLKANSLGALTLTSDLVHVLRHHATGVAHADLRISCPESKADAALKGRIYIPGVCILDGNVSQFCFDPAKAKGMLAERLRKLLRFVLGKAEYQRVDYVEIFSPGENMLRWRGDGKYAACQFDIHEQDPTLDEALEEAVAFTGYVNPRNRVFIGVRPVFKEYAVVMRDSAGHVPDPKKGERPSFKFSVPCKRWSGCTLAEFRKQVQASCQFGDDLDSNHTDICISQVLPRGVEELHSGTRVAGASSRIHLRTDMDETDWAIISRLIISSTIHVQRLPPWTVLTLEKQRQELPYGFSHTMWNSGTPSSGLFSPLQPFGAAPVGDGQRAGHKDGHTSAAEGRAQAQTQEAATPKAATTTWAEGSRTSTLEAQPEPAYLRRPPSYFSKYPLSQAERDAIARETYFAEPISIYEQDGPRIPTFGPPVEQFLYSGPSVPSISRSMMTATEQLKLSKAFVKMRNIAVGRTHACPFKGCEETFRLGDTAAIHEHAEKAHSTEKCNFCDERLYKHWDATQRRRHFLDKHSALFLTKEDLAKDAAAGAVVVDKNLCARRERAYNFCPRCGRDHRALGRHADRVQHDNTCNPSINHAEARPFCFCEDCPASKGDTTPHLAKDCCGRDACRTYSFCEECGEPNADGGCPHPEAKCRAKDARHVGRAPYCMGCGLALAPFSGPYRSKHLHGCRGFNGTPDAFCPWCGIAASSARWEWLAHLRGCDKNTGENEGPLDLVSGKPLDSPPLPAGRPADLPHKQGFMYEYSRGGQTLPCYCQICGEDFTVNTGKGHWDHYETEHPDVDGWREHCPYCEDLPFASFGWGSDEKGTAKKMIHFQHHIDWTKDVLDTIDIQGEGRDGYLEEVDAKIDAPAAAPGRDEASEQLRTLPGDASPARGRDKGKIAAHKVDIRGRSNPPAGNAFHSQA